jgi:hypothetical protein
VLAGLASLAVRSGRSNDLEIIVLRHQLAVLRRTTKPVVTEHDRSLLAAIAKALPRALRDGWIVTPDTAAVVTNLAKDSTGSRKSRTSSDDVCRARKEDPCQ